MDGHVQPGKKDKGPYSSSWEPHLRAMGRHLLYRITQCFTEHRTQLCAMFNIMDAIFILEYMLNMPVDKEEWRNWTALCVLRADWIGLRSKVPYLLILRSKWDVETAVWRLFYYITLWCVCLSVLVIITISFIGVAVCLLIIFVGIACLRRYHS